MLSTRRVIVFGSSNVGKTSMLNALTNSTNETSSNAIGTTFGTEKFPTYERNNILYEFFDTAGLNESDGGLVSPEDACDNIFKLLIECTEGFNLLILVVRIGSILQADKTNYDLFVEDLTNRQIPTICVITGCENEEPDMATYAKNNREHYLKKGMTLEKIVSACFVKGGRFEKMYRPLRETSAKEVWKAIEDAASNEPIATVKEQPESMKVNFLKVWNRFCVFIKRPTWQRTTPRSEKIYEILSRMGIKDEAKKKALAEMFTQVNQ